MSKLLVIIDMNNGFVNAGAMANPEYMKLVPEQVKMLNKFDDEKEEIIFVLEAHNKDSVEFKKYPEHCVIGTAEAELIHELKPYQKPNDMNTFYKNSINGMLNQNLQYKIKRLKDLKEVVIEGVCADLCVFDFAITLSRYFDELNREVKIYIVRDAVDTYDSPDHNREKWLNMTEEFLTQAGIEYVDNIKDLEEREKKLFK